MNTVDQLGLDYYLKNNSDTGCEVSTSCLSCPLPQCKHDDPQTYQAAKQRGSDLQRVSEMERDGLTVEEAAERFGVTVRTVWRVKARVRALAN